MTLHLVQKALVETSRCDINMSTFALKFKVVTYKNLRSKTFIDLKKQITVNFDIIYKFDTFLQFFTIFGFQKTKSNTKMLYYMSISTLAAF